MRGQTVAEADLLEGVADALRALVNLEALAMQIAPRGELDDALLRASSGVNTIAALAAERLRELRRGARLAAVE